MFFARCVWWCIWGGRFPFRDTDTVKVDNSGGFYSFNAKPSRNASQGVTCKTYDPTKACTAGVFYKLLDSDSIVATGIVCAGSATPVTAIAGKWLCLKSVPVLANDGTDLAKYIPTLPAASGSLDPDNADNYWEFFTPSQICDGVI